MNSLPHPRATQPHRPPSNAPQSPSPQSPSPILAALALAALAFSPHSALADSVVARVGSTDLTFDNVKISQILDGKLVFETDSGREEDKDLTSVQSIHLDDEKDLDAAEDAYAAGNFSDAADAYQRAIATTTKDWLKDWAAVRLIAAANKANRFDAAAAGYVQLALKDPAAAQPFKPTIADGSNPGASSPDSSTPPASTPAAPTPDTATPAPSSTALDAAAQTVADALKTLDDDASKQSQQQALLGFLLEIQQARKDNAAVAHVAARLMKFSAATGDAGALKVLVESRLAVARSDVDQQKFADAIALINDTAASVVDPSQQADALFIVARAREGLASAKNDPSSWHEAALAYMRVVANFKDQTDNPRISQSLLKSAAILEKLNQTADALALYQQIVTGYNGSAAAAEAQKAIDRLQAAASGNSPGDAKN
jgi:tetratricopeptide (TPR) repeat protein